jgi:DNA-binding NarL/FixJ family response regulator
MIAFRRGESDLAYSQLRGCSGAEGDYEPRRPANVFRCLYVALALRAEAAGDATRAVQLWAAWLDVPLTAGDYWVAPHLVRAALNTGDVATAQAAIAHCVPDLSQPAAEQVLAHRLGQDLIEDNTTDLLTCAESARQHGWLPLQAFALEEAAVRLAEQGHTPEAKHALNRAVKLYADFGALQDIRRVDGRMRPHGIRRGPRSLHRRTTHGWQALTPSEQRVATLVAQGLSNPDIAAQLFLARTTVQTHVSAILNKLSLHSRIELIRHYTTITKQQ